MKILKTDEANSYLEQVGMRIEDWNQIIYLSAPEQKPFHIHYHAPSEANKLFNFSLHVAGWLPKGKWKIFQVDNSTSMNAVESYLFGRILCGINEIMDFRRNRTFLFEFGLDQEQNKNTELLIANLIQIFLQHECHGYVVSSASTSGQLLGIQDGFAYFISKEEDISGAQILLNKFEQSQLSYPDWALEIVKTRQDQEILGNLIH